VTTWKSLRAGDRIVCPSTDKSHGTIDVEIAQMGELGEALRGHITGAQVIVEAPDGHRYGLVGLRWEPTLEHPQGRLVLVTSDCVHWSEDCDPEVAERG
jgi:hypothetical protein